MSKRIRAVARTLVIPSIAVGCTIVGCALEDSSGVVWLSVGCAVLLATLAVVKCCQYVPDSELQVRETHAWKSSASDEVALLVQDLFSPYTQCVIAAADRLGEIRDAWAVPSLISVLDRSAWRPEPGWSEVTESIVMSLARIGDGRCLPVLNRVRLARGQDLRDTVDVAIAAITNTVPLGNHRTYAKPNSGQKKSVPPGWEAHQVDSSPAAGISAWH